MNKNIHRISKNIIEDNFKVNPLNNKFHFYSTESVKL